MISPQCKSGSATVPRSTPAATPPPRDGPICFEHDLQYSAEWAKPREPYDFTKKKSRLCVRTVSFATAGVGPPHLHPGFRVEHDLLLEFRFPELLVILLRGEVFDLTINDRAGVLVGL